MTIEEKKVSLWGGYSSGQRVGTVNPAPKGFGGSNPPLPIINGMSNDIINADVETADIRVV